MTHAVGSNQHKVVIYTALHLLEKKKTLWKCSVYHLYNYLILQDISITMSFTLWANAIMLMQLVAFDKAPILELLYAIRLDWRHEKKKTTLSTFIIKLNYLRKWINTFSTAKCVYKYSSRSIKKCIQNFA